MIAEGLIRGENGDPIAGAAVAIKLPESFASRFSDAFWYVAITDWEGSSAADGTFSFQAAPALEGCMLTVEAAGFKPATRPLFATSLSTGAEGPREVKGLEVILERIDPRTRVSGRVVDPSGDPVERAWVGLGPAMQSTDADGRFELVGGDKQESRAGPTQLIAAAKGWESTSFDPPLDGEGAPVWPASVELRFARETLSIAGVLLDAEGLPQANAFVWIEDPTVIGARFGQAFAAERLTGDQGTLWQKYPTGSDGRFRIPGLAKREYTLLAVDLGTLHLSVPKQVRAGTEDAVLQLDPSVQVSRTAGRIVDARGDGVAGASISLQRIVLFLSNPDGRGANVAFGETEGILTDQDGNFDLGALPLHPGTSLYLHKPGYTVIKRALVDLPLPLDQLEITLDSRCRARIVAGESLSEVPTSAELRTATGEALEVTTALENGAAFSTSITLTEGNSKTFEVSGAAALAVLYARGEVIATLPLRLKPEGVNEIAP